MLRLLKLRGEMHCGVLNRALYMCMCVCLSKIVRFEQPSRRREACGDAHRTTRRVAALTARPRRCGGRTGVFVIICWLLREDRGFMIRVRCLVLCMCI